MHCFVDMVGAGTQTLYNHRWVTTNTSSSSMYAGEVLSSLRPSKERRCSSICIIATVSRYCAGAGDIVEADVFSPVARPEWIDDRESSSHKDLGTAGKRATVKCLNALYMFESYSLLKSLSMVSCNHFA